MRAAGPARTLGAVLGLGVLVLPAALAPADPWTVTVLAGGLACWCLLVAASGGTARAGPVAFVRDRLGPAPARAVTALYFGGFATGQAAVALAAAEFAAGRPGWGGGSDSGWGNSSFDESGWGVFALAAAVLATAAGHAAYTPYPLSAGARRLRLGAVLGLAAAWWLLGRPTAAPSDWAPVLLTVPLLFGWVGLESAVPALRQTGGSGPRPVSGPEAGPAGTAPPAQHFGATLLGLVLAAGLYGLLLRPAGWLPAPHPAVLLVLGLASAAVCWTYCRTNLLATGARWSELTAAGQRAGILAGAAVALAALLLARLAGWGTPALLIGPGTATAAIYLFIAVAAVRRPRPRKEPTRHDHRHRPLEGAARSAR
ncbi:hypothetical protein ACFWUQ_04940 [Streptomyces sp. NPDC058662]|uniref:hypothetical protein n=1 Tax=Streptomyces sp. NPDC058662 TaxID=3346583 RepID=UPI00364DDCB0